jgi:outer membrane cobalamin receptor
MKRLSLPALLLSLSLPASAESAPSQGTLDPLLITASRMLQPLSTITSRAIILSSAAIRTAPAHAADDLLRTVPGINMKATASNVVNPVLQTVSLVGFGARQTLVLWDGLPLSDGAGGHITWNKVPVNLIDRVEVIRGGNSSIYGSGAMGGVINVITKSPAKRSAELDASYATQDTRRFYGYASETIKDKVGIGLGYNYYQTDGYLWLPENVRGPVDKKSWAKNWTANLKLNSLGGPGADNDWFLRANAFHDNRNHGLDDWYDARDHAEVAGGAGTYLGSGRLSGNFYMGKYDLDSTNASVNAARTTQFVSIHNYIPYLDTGGGLQWAGDFRGDDKLVFGVDTRHINYRNNEDQYTGGLPSGSVSQGGKQINLGAFSAFTLKPTESLTFDPSLRVDHWETFDSFQVAVGGARSGLTNKRFQFLSPRVGARWQAGEALALRGAVYRAFVAPNPEQLWRTARPAGTVWLPNPALGPEKLNFGTELGTDWTREMCGAHLTGYWNEISDALVRVFSTATQFQTQNLGRIRNRGFVAETYVRPLRDTRTSLSYTYVDSVITRNPVNTAVVGRTPPETPRHQLSGEFSYDNPAILQATLRGRYLSRRWNDDANTQLLDDHFILDASISRRFWERYEAYVIGENLLDRQYIAWQLSAVNRFLGYPRYIGAGLRAYF